MEMLLWLFVLIIGCLIILWGIGKILEWAFNINDD